MTITNKVFLFNRDIWLLVENIRFKDGVYTGNVVNGQWMMTYDAINHTLFDTISVQEDVQHEWIADADSGIDYNAVIAKAKERHKSGESPNYSISTVQVVYDHDLEVQVPY